MKPRPYNAFLKRSNVCSIRITVSGVRQEEENYQEYHHHHHGFGRTDAAQARPSLSDSDRVTAVPTTLINSSQFQAISEISNAVSDYKLISSMYERDSQYFLIIRRDSIVYNIFSLRKAARKVHIRITKPPLSRPHGESRPVVVE